MPLYTLWQTQNLKTLKIQLGAGGKKINKYICLQPKQKNNNQHDLTENQNNQKPNLPIYEHVAYHKPQQPHYGVYA